MLLSASDCHGTVEWWSQFVGDPDTGEAPSAANAAPSPQPGGWMHSFKRLVGGLSEAGKEVLALGMPLIARDCSDCS